MNIVTVNGKTYSLPDGGSVSVINNKVYHNGKLITDCNDFHEKEIKITVNGDIDSLQSSSADILIKGNVGSVTSTSGDVTVCGDVKGNCTSTSGDITANNIGGDSNTVSGDIKTKKRFSVYPHHIWSMNFLERIFPSINLKENNMRK